MADFKIFGYKFLQENYPPDIVPFTEWRDYQNPYEKYFQQLVLDVDTNGKNIPLYVEGDGAIKQTLTINSTASTRDVVKTLNPVIKARKVRLRIGTLPAAGKFQLFTHDFVWLPADKGPVTHSYDWDDLGWPYDKHLKRITFEYDTLDVDTTMLMDIMTGIEGGTITTAHLSFVLNQTSRAKQQFIIPDGTVVKMIRIYPSADDTNFKVWKYVVDKVDYPPDKIAATEWEDLDYPCEKILRELILDVDTGSVNAQVSIQADGATHQIEPGVKTSRNDRHRIITLNSDIIGKRFRIVPVAGTGGKFQLFNHKFNAIIEPCAVHHWDSYEQAFNYNGWKFIKQMWIEYMCSVEIIVKIYRENDVLFHTVTLPAHAHRDKERFYLPAISSDGVLNKSRIYRFVIDSCDECVPFKLYRDGTRVEVMPLAGDQRQGYSQCYLWQTIPIPALA